MLQTGGLIAERSGNWCGMIAVNWRACYWCITITLLHQKRIVLGKSVGRKTFHVSGTVKFRHRDGEITAVPLKLSANNATMNVIELYADLDPQDTYLEIAERVSKYMGDQSGDIVEIEYHILDFKGQKLADVKMKAARLHYRLLDGLSNIKQRDGYCVIDYLWNEIKGQARMKSMTLKKLNEELTDFCDVEDGISTTDIVNWKTKYHKHISVFAIDPFCNVFISNPATDPMNRLVLAFIVNNGHLYPVTDESTKRFITNGKRLPQIKTHMEEFKFQIKMSGDSYTLLTTENVDQFAQGKLDGKVFVNVDPALDMRDIAHSVMESSNLMVECFDFRSSTKLNAFQHPQTEQVVMDGNDFENRKKCCEILHKQMPVEQFDFKNNSYTQVARSLLDIKMGFIRKSTYNEQALNMLDSYFPAALIQTIDDQTKLPKGTVGSDICKSYSNVILKNKFKFPVYNIHCKVEDYDGEEIVCGEYYIDATELKFKSEQEHAITLKPAFYSWNVITYLLQKKHIRKSDIKLQFRAAYSEPADCFKEFVEYIYNTFENTIAKKLVNFLIGFWDSKYNKNFTGCITDSVEVLASILSESKVKPSVDFLNGMFLIRRETKSRLGSDHTSLWRHVICGGIVQLLEVCEKVHDNNFRFIGVNTDCVYYVGDSSKINGVKTNNILQNIGGVFAEEKVRPKLYHEYEHTNLDTSDFTVENGLGKIITGPPGAGKTELLKEMVEKEDSYVVLCGSNKACVNVNARCGERVAFTFDSYLPPALNDEQKAKKLDKTVYVDEFSMLDDHWITVIYKAFLKNRNRVYFFGDKNQLTGIEEGNVLPINYIESTAMRQMCPTLEVVPFNPKTGRYTQKLYDILTKFIESGELDHKFSGIADDLDTNMCYSNAKRRSVNHKRESKMGTKVTCVYKGDKERYVLNVGDDVVCTKNMKKINMFNAEKFTITAINDTSVTVNKETFPTAEFGKFFLPNWCTTVHRYQGDTVRVPFNIHEANCNKMNRNMLYTAISRATHEDNVHIGNIKSYYAPQEYADGLQDLEPHKTAYHSGKIYHISDGEHHYVGQTVKDIKTRFEEHLVDEKGTVYKWKVENPTAELTIQLVANVPCTELPQLLEYETTYIQKFEDKYGTPKMLNKKQLRTKPKTVEKKPELEIKVARKVNEKRFKIVDCGAKNTLRIQYRDGEGKKKEVSKKYNPNDLDSGVKLPSFEEAMKQMEGKRDALILSLDEM